MIELQNESDFVTLFSSPFSPKKYIFPPRSDFFHDGNAFWKVPGKRFIFDTDDEELLHKTYKEFPCDGSGCKETFTNLRSYEIHHSSRHRLVCSECKKVFPSYTLLDSHIQDRHDAYYALQCKKTNMYSCFTRNCTANFSSDALRNQHMIQTHSYPKDFKFGQSKQIKKVEEMDTDHKNGAKMAYKPRVPQNICFGRGSSRGFQRGRRPRPSARGTDPGEITMQDLEDALYLLPS